MAYTTLATQSAGQTASAAGWANVVKANFEATMHLLARKSADQIVNNSTTLVNDTHLVFPVAASEVWMFNTWLMFDGSATPDIKFHWTVPSSATMKWAPIGSDDASNFASWGAALNPALALLTESTTINFSTIGVGTTMGLGFAAIATIAGVAGNVQLQWAQNFANATDTIVRANSCIIGCRLTP